jgi:hypothetical protein
VQSSMGIWPSSRKYANGIVPDPSRGAATMCRDGLADPSRQRDCRKDPCRSLPPITHVPRTTVSQNLARAGCLAAVGGFANRLAVQEIFGSSRRTLAGRNTSGIGGIRPVGARISLGGLRSGKASERSLRPVQPPWGAYNADAVPVTQSRKMLARVTALAMATTRR